MPQQVPSAPPSSRPRILIADDHPMIVEALTGLLGPAMEIVGHARSGRQALELTRQLLPDLLILDIAMPELDGLAVARQLRRLGLGVPVLVLSFHLEESWVRGAFEAGAAGYLCKTSAPQEIQLAVAEVLAGRFWVSPAIAQRWLVEPPLATAPTATHPPQSSPKAAPKAAPMAAPKPIGPPAAIGLTPREAEILSLLAENLGNKEIARRLGVSVTTVRTHLGSIYEKLEVDGRVGLALYAASFRRAG